MAHTVEQHFINRSPEVVAIYAALREMANGFGEWEEDPKKTSIHFNRRTAFIGVATRRESVILTIKSNRAIENPRIVKSLHASARRWYHEVRLRSISEVDAELLGWLQEAYELSA